MAFAWSQNRQVSCTWVTLGTLSILWLQRGGTQARCQSCAPSTPSQPHLLPLEAFRAFLGSTINLYAAADRYVVRFGHSLEAAAAQEDCIAAAADPHRRTCHCMTVSAVLESSSAPVTEQAALHC